MAGELAGAAGALLDAGALESGAADTTAGAEGVAVTEAELDDAACELELLLHPANATDTAMAAENQILEYDNRDIS